MKLKFILFFAAMVAVLNGCSSDYTVLHSFESIILTADSSVKVVGAPVTFTVKDNSGQDLTGDAVFYVDGEAIEGNTFTSAETGTFHVQAKYEGVSSDELTITYHDGSEINYRKRVLVEDYTGTWCGYCPRVAYAVERLKEQTDDVVAVAIHRPTGNQSSSTYDPYNYDTSVLEDFIDVPGYPKGMLNRITQWNFPEPDNLAQAIALTQGENPKLGLALTPVVSGGNITLDVNVKFSKDFSDLKLVVYVLENGLIYDQHNYTDYYDGLDIIPNFQHNHVLRACLTPLLGETVSSSESAVGNTFTRTFTVAMPQTVANAANIEFVAFITDAAGNALNAREALPGEVQGFEEL